MEIQFNNLPQLLFDLSLTIPPAQYDKLAAALEYQRQINSIEKKLKKIMRRLKSTLPHSDYHKIGMAIEMEEANKAEADRTTLLENRAIRNYLIKTEFDPSEWLAPTDALDLMFLQNAEAKAFETDEAWSQEFIVQFKQTNNL